MSQLVANQAAAAGNVQLGSATVDDVSTSVADENRLAAGFQYMFGEAAWRRLTWTLARPLVASLTVPQMSAVAGVLQPADQPPL